MAGALNISGAAEITIKPTSERPLVLNVQTCHQRGFSLQETGPRRDSSFHVLVQALLLLTQHCQVEHWNLFNYRFGSPGFINEMECL